MLGVRRDGRRVTQYNKRLSTYNVVHTVFVFHDGIRLRAFWRGLYIGSADRLYPARVNMRVNRAHAPPRDNERI